MRDEAHLLCDSGDCIKAGNLAIPMREESAWSLLARAGCDIGTIGNREAHPLESGFEAKLRGRRHPVLCANVRRKDGAPFLPASVVRTLEGITVGFIGAMVPVVTERMVTQAASAYLWEQPIPVVQRIAKVMRREVDVLIALTHIGFAQDRSLAETTPELDLIFGGHSHTVLWEPVRIGATWICQGGSHARFVGRYTWQAGARLVEGKLLPLKGSQDA